ncbi:non-oxidative hydroxyarylic acid decarboxylases subunit D [Candidatus Omnitrophota bacterium]
MDISACPRCDSSDVHKIADSPVKGKFEVYRCEACNYVWRSTEDLTNIDKSIDYFRENAKNYYT